MITARAKEMKSFIVMDVLERDAPINTVECHA